jgi:hypothetical protein
MNMCVPFIDRYCIENLCPAANRDESGDGSANETSNEVQRPQGYQRGEELLLNTVSALANLSFYLNVRSCWFAVESLL